jgi:ArsR family transcriptional regulator, arsenate/arsenite/antimonite-responsive transcriptional repressor
MPAPAKTRVDLMFRAFSDPVRLRILHLVQDGELCVCDLVAILRLPQPEVSRHLSYLRKAGLVSVRQPRSWNFYTLVPGRTAFHKRLLACLGTCFQDVPELTTDLARAREIRIGEGCSPG